MGEQERINLSWAVVMYLTFRKIYFWLHYNFWRRFGWA